jgi:Ca2+-binding EF-hand superfamily protein
MVKLLIGAAVTALAGAAIAQAPVPAPAPMAPERVMTRDSVVAQVRDHFARLDTNRDGFVAQDEMAAMRAHRMGQRGQRMGGQRMAMRDPAQAFDRLDANKDGVLSRDEFARGRELRRERMVMRGPMQGNRMGAMRGGMLRMADADRDGRVSLAEAQAAAVRHFDMMDANRDGTVTREERRGARERMRAMHGRQPG